MYREQRKCLRHKSEAQLTQALDLSNSFNFNVYLKYATYCSTDVKLFSFHKRKNVHFPITRTLSYLVCVEFNIYQRHPLVQLVVVFDHTMNRFRNILKYQVKIKFILFSCWKEAMLQRNDIRVVKKTHGLQLTVLVPLVLQNLLYSNSFTSL